MGSWRGLWFATAMAGSCICAQGQGPGVAPPPPPGAPQRRSMEALSELRMLTQSLNLTNDQREKLRPVVTDEGEQLHVVHIDERMTPDQKRAKVVEIREAFAPKIAAELTPEQQEKWKKLQESLQGKKPEAGKDQAAPTPPPK
jgi:periplasmic protein CpxP/Spy